MSKTYSKSVAIMIGDVEYQVEAVWDDEKQTSALTGDALSTLRNNRFFGRGIPYTKNSKSIRYFRPDTFRHMAARRVSTSDAE